MTKARMTMSAQESK